MSGVQIIDVPGQGEVEFPADMPDAEIQRVIKRNLLAPNKFSETPGGAALSMRGSVGFGKRGDTMGDIHRARDKMVYEAGGLATDLTGSPGAGSFANAAADAVTDPLTYVGGGLGKLGQSAAVSQAKSWMQQALRPTFRDLDLGKADRAAQTLLDEGINVTRGGIEKLRMMGTALNKQVDDIIARWPWATVDKGQAAGRIHDLIAKIESSNWAPQEARAAAEKVYDSILSNPLTGSRIPIAKAQEYKQTIYKALKDKYGELGSDTTEAMKAGARGLKEEIENLQPEVKAVNERASDIWNALNVTERRALMAGNNQTGGLAWLTHNPWSFSATMADRSSAIKSILARALYSGVAPNSTVAGAGMGALIGQQLEQ